MYKTGATPMQRYLVYMHAARVVYIRDINFFERLLPARLATTELHGPSHDVHRAWRGIK